MHALASRHTLKTISWSGGKEQGGRRSQDEEHLSEGGPADS